MRTVAVPSSPAPDEIPAPAAYPPPSASPSPSLPSHPLSRPLLATLLRKPLSAYNNAGPPKSAFKTPKLDSDARDRRVSFFSGAPPPSAAPSARHRVSLLGRPDAADDAADANPKTPAQSRPTAPRVSHRRAGMRTRKGTGRSVAARTFSLVLRVAAPPAAEEDGADVAAPARRARSGDSDGAAPATLGSRDGASGVAGRSEGASGSVDGEAPGGSGGSVGMAREPGSGYNATADLDDGDDDEMTKRLDAIATGGDPSKRKRSMGFFAANANAGEDDGTGTIEIDVTPGEDGMMSLVPYRSSPEEDVGASRLRAAAGSRDEPPLADVGFDDDDGGFGGGFDDYDGDDWAGATPAPRGALVDGSNDPMTGGLDAVGGKKRMRRAAGPRRPAGTPHKLERARMAKRKSLAAVGAGSRHDLENEDGVPVRRSTRQRTRPLEYWRGETKRYVRVHQSLPTVETMTHRTPNPMWPRHKTPHHAHGGGAIIAVGGSVPLDSERASRRAGEEARRRALELADVAHLSDGDEEDDSDAETVAAGEEAVAAAAWASAAAARAEANDNAEETA